MKLTQVDISVASVFSLDGGSCVCFQFAKSALLSSLSMFCFLSNDSLSKNPVIKKSPAVCSFKQRLK